MTKHINPGTDTTINPVVIDDSYRERKQPTPFTYTLRLKMDGQFPGAPDYDEWVISEDVYNFVKASYNALKLKKISDSDPLSRTHTPAHINPVVIKQEYDPIFIGLINYFKEIQWQRVESEIPVTEIVEILTDFAKMEAEETASHTGSSSHPTEAQKRVDAAIKELQLALDCGMHESIEPVIKEAIALLQAGRK